MDDPRRRYLCDPEFHQLVDLILSWIMKCQYSLTEVREAAMLAAIMYAERYALPTWMKRHPDAN